MTFATVYTIQKSALGPLLGPSYNGECDNKTSSGQMAGAGHHELCSVRLTKP